jgi:hypothetical protein
MFVLIRTDMRPVSWPRTVQHPYRNGRGHDREVVGTNRGQLENAVPADRPIAASARAAFRRFSSSGA